MANEVKQNRKRRHHNGGVPTLLVIVLLIIAVVMGGLGGFAGLADGKDAAKPGRADILEAGQIHDEAAAAVLYLLLAFLGELRNGSGIHAADDFQDGDAVLRAYLYLHEELLGVSDS